MYKPVPARPKKTNIVRNREGCGPCRRIHRKCDESKPGCRRCEKNGRACWYGGHELRWHDSTSWAALKSKQARGDETQPERNEKGHRKLSSPQSDSSVAQSQDFPPQGTASSWQQWLSLPYPLSSGQSPSDGADDFQISIPPTLLSSNNVRNYGSAADTDLIMPWPAYFDFFWQPTGAVSDRQYSEPGDTPAVLNTWSSSDTAPCTSSSNAIVTTPEISMELICLAPTNDTETPALDTGIKECSAFQEFPFFVLDYCPIPLGLSDACISAGDRQYLAHFSSLVVRLLPQSLEPLRELLGGSEIVISAAMAVGAANMAAQYGRYAPYGHNQEANSWVPNIHHKVSALRYVERVLSLATSQHTPAVTLRILAHVLLSFVELELGTFDGLQRHFASIDHLIYESQQPLLSCNYGPALFGFISDCRTFQQFLGGARNPRVDLPKDHLLVDLQSVLATEAYVQKIGSDALLALHRLCLFECMRHNMDCSSPARDLLVEVFSSFLLPHHGQATLSETEILSAYQETRSELEYLSEQARHCRLPEGVPDIDTQGNVDSSSLRTDGVHNCSYSDAEPLRFRSHNDAMKAADYVFCRIICDEAAIRNVISPGNPTDIPVAHGWMGVLIQIAKGLSKVDCFQRNAYRRGILSILFQCALWTRNVATLDFLEGFYRDFARSGTAWEDPTFPTTHAATVIEVVKDQFKQNRTILLLTLVEKTFDRNRCIKFIRPTPVSLTLCGRVASGHLFDERVILDHIF